MIRKVFAAAVVMCFFPMVALASSWFFGTQVKTGGGRMDSPNMSGQRVVDNVIYRTYTTSGPLRATVTADPGFTIRAVTVGDTTVSEPASPYLATVDGSMTNPKVTATFVPASLSVTAVNPFGTVTPSSVGNAVYGYTLRNPLTFSFVPATGYQITGIDNLPSDPKVSHSSFSPGVNKPVTVTFATGYAFTADLRLQARAENITPAIAHILPQTVLTGTPNVTLRASTVNVSNPVFTWRYVSGPANTPVMVRDGAGKLVRTDFIPGPQLDDLAGTGTAAATFTAPSVCGQYKFQVSVPVDSDPSHDLAMLAVVNVYASVTQAATNQCLFCHKANGVGNPAIYANWSGSAHQLNHLLCAKCHVGTDSGGHPGALTSGSVSETTFSYRWSGGNFCLNGSCHAPGITHKTDGMACATCHNSGEIHRTDASFAAAVNVCFTCHGGANTPHYYVNTGLATSLCLACHTQSGHNPAPPASVPRVHFNGYTSYANPSYAAAYVTPRTACSDCHLAGDATSPGDLLLKQYRQDWGASGHGDTAATPWRSLPGLDWKSAGTVGGSAAAGAGTDCVRCHSAAGYRQYLQDGSLGPVAAASDHSSEPLACNACHNPDFSVRAVPPVTAYYNYSSPTTGKLLASSAFADLKLSNICLSCHAGRVGTVTLAAIGAKTAQESYSSSYWRNTPFIDGHYLAAAGTLPAAAGYRYPGQDYGNYSVDHSLVAVDAGAGPCVGCHMQGAIHSYQARAGAVCDSCHGSGSMTSELLASRKAELACALKALQEALTQRGFAPLLGTDGKLRYPYFGTSNWGDAQTGAGNMGAAHNFSLLSHDPGAYAHNPTYVKRLVRDSIDWLMNGSVNRSRDLTPALATLLSSPDDLAAASSFLSGAASGVSACTVCHSGSLDLAKNPIVATYNASVHGTRAGGPSCASCHAPVPATPHPAKPMLTDTAAVSAKCSGCHAPHTWSSIGICTNCHNGHNPWQIAMPAPHYANFSTAQYITPNYTCDNCHTEKDEFETASFHVYSANAHWARSGKGNALSPSYLGGDFKLLGSTQAASQNATGNDCVRCHTTTGYINYVNSGFQDITSWGRADDRTREMIMCAACHDPTPFFSYDRWDDATQTDYPPYSRRAVPQVTAYYNYSGGKKVTNAVVMKESYESNNCVVCHSGKVAGTTLKAMNGNLTVFNPFWSDTTFIDPHGMGAAGILYKQTGYMYSHLGRTYVGEITGHGGLGVETVGPCIACHMSTDKPHLFSPISSASNGTIGKITAFDQLCSYCHTGGTNDLTDLSKINAYKQQCASSLKALAAVLASKGIYYNGSLAPYFFTTEDPAQQGASTAYRNWNANYSSGRYYGVDVIGAAFNLRLLASDAGAYTHHDIYAKWLIYDSIDLLDNGSMDKSVYATIQNLQLSDSFSQDDKDRALIYVGTRPASK